MNSDADKNAGEIACHMKTKPVYWTTGTCAVEIPVPCGLVIFGASGDLTKRKILPAVYRLQKNHLLPEEFFVLGTSRTKMSTDQFREEVLSAVKNAFAKDFDESVWNGLVEKIYYVPIDYTVQETYTQLLKEELLQLGNETPNRRKSNLLSGHSPTLYEHVISNLGAAGLSRERTGLHPRGHRETFWPGRRFSQKTEPHCEKLF